MSDIFSIYDDEEENSVTNTASKGTVFSLNDAANAVNAQQQNRELNQSKYGFDAPDQIYTLLDNFAQQNNFGNDATDNYARLATAYQYTQLLGVSLDEAFQNVEKYNAAIWGEDIFENKRKDNAKAIGDMWRLGVNTVRQNKIANEWRKAEIDGDTEYANELKAALDAMDEQNATYQDYNPRNKIIKGMEIVAQAAPFTLDTIAASAVGSLVGAGAGVAFLETQAITQGSVYKNLRDQGNDVDISNKVSGVVAVIESAVELSLGEEAAYLVTKGKKAVGSQLDKTAAKKLTDFVTKKFALNNGFKKTTELVSQYALSSIGEMSEEAVQEITEIVGENVAAWMSENNVPNNDAKEITGRIMEAFKGGLIGGLGLGLPGLAFNTGVGMVQVKQMESLARSIPSEEAFKEEMKAKHQAKDGSEYSYADMINSENEADLDRKLHDLWQSQSKVRDEVNYGSVKDIAEINTAEEGYEDTPEEKEDGETKVSPAKRNAQGELDAENVINENEDGTFRGQYRVGTTSKESKNLYGYIDYSIDKEDKSITINKFSMDEKREALRQEVFEQFAAENAGYTIDWNTKGKNAKAIKQALINNNLNGKNNGLTYYKDVNDLNDAKTRRDVAKQVRINMKNINASQVPAAVAYLETLAKARGMTLNQYYSKNFGESIFGDVKEAEAIANANNQTFQGKRGGTSWRQLGNEVKAVIYAGENADFSTFIHEMAHVWQQALSRDADFGDVAAQEQLKTLEEAFNVVDHDWRNSNFNFNDGVNIKTQTASEAFAYGLEDYLKTGKANSKELSDLFKQLAQFVANTMKQLFNYITLSPEIQKAYDSMMQDDDTVLAKAYRDALKADREIRENEKTAQEEKAKQEAEQQREKAAEEKDAEEVTMKQESNVASKETTEETALEKNMPTPSEVASEVEKQNEAGMDVTTADAISNVEQYTAEQQADQEVQQIVENNAANAIPEDVYNALTDNKETLAAKQDAASETADVAKKIDDIAFQVMNESLFNTLNNSMFKTQLASELYAAKVDINKLGGVNVRKARKTIKSLYNWEWKNGQWYLETHDDKIKVNMEVVKPYLYGNNTDAIALDSFYNDPEMFTLIPQLKQLKVSFNNDINAAASLSKIEGKEIVINKARLQTKGHSQVNLRNAIIYSLQIMLNEASELTSQKIAYFPNSQEVLARVVVSRAMQDAKYRNNLLLDEYDPNLIDFQVIGELGATNLDRAEEITTRMDNLSIAREMEANGKDPLNIRLATGWEKGVDGKWKYEIEDDYKLKNNSKTNPRIKLYEDQIKKAQQKVDYYNNLTEEEAEKVRRKIDEAVKHNAMPEGTTLESMMQDAENELKTAQLLLEYDSVLDPDKALKTFIENGINPRASFWEEVGPGYYLKDIIENERLFKAYPELERYLIEFSKESIGGVAARFTPEDKCITIFPEAAIYFGRFKSSLAHELQHAIQNIEGFATGGSVENIVRQRQINNPLTPAQLKFIADVKLYNENAASMRPDFTVQEFLKGQIKYDNEDNTYYDDFQRDYIYGSNPEDIQKNYERWSKQNQDYEEKLKTQKSPGELYKSLAGEVEARNVQSRINFDPEKRDNTLLSETADVSPYDQIIMFAAVNMNEENNQYEEVKKNYENTDKWLKAPNGKETNLSEKQWIQVRTPNFKQWFGDWENDPENASKVIDENGEPLVVYHGTKDNFSVFSTRKTATPQFWFTNRKDLIEAGEVGAAGNGIIMPVFLNIKNPAGWHEEDNFGIDQIISRGFDGKDLTDGDVKTYVAFESNQIKSAVKNNGNFDINNPNIDFQTAYHGTAADFDKFNTEEYGFSGEGSMSFGYGTYVTASEEIARDYARRQVCDKNLDPYAREREEIEEDIKNNARRLNDYPVEIETAKKFVEKKKEEYQDVLKSLKEIEDKYGKDSVEYENEVFLLVPEDYKKRIDIAEKYAAEKERFLEEEKKRTAELQEKKKKFDEEHPTNRHLLTVDIPDGGFIKWDKDANSKTIEKVKRELLKEIFSTPDSAYYSYSPLELKKEFDSVFQYVQGQQLYNNVSAYLEGDQKASEFLNKIGYTGIDYPAGSIHGNGDNARNFVIFNDNDVRIISKLDFQEEQINSDNFKQWFGDWKEDPENASKVIDENGKPLVVYHGTKNFFLSKPFSVFNTDAPAWFAANDNYAKEYYSEKNIFQKPVLYEAYLNIKNPLDVGDIDNGGLWVLQDLAKKTGIPLEELEAQNFEYTSWIWQVTNDPKFKKLAESKGYDGLIATENGGKTYAVFNPEQIKSATNNNGNFNPADPRIDYQTDGTLYGVHNLSEDAIKHVFKMGGLANPSLAVADKDVQIHENFGDISLIAYNSFINKSTGNNAGTYGADIYSPRYPSITKTVTDTGSNKIKSIFWAIEDPQLKYDFTHKFTQSLENDGKLNYLYTTLPIAYLAEKGNKDFWKYEKSQYSDEVKDLIKSLGPTPFIESGKDAEIVKEAYRKSIYGDLEEKLANKEKDLETETSDFVKNIIKKDIDQTKVRLKLRQETFESYIDPKTGNLYSGTADSFYYSVKKDMEKVGSIDEYATERAAREIVENDPDFQKWANEKVNSIEVDEKIFNGYTPSGNRRYLTHTLENVSKFMKQEATRGGENFNYGMGSARALVTPKFTTLKQIRDNKDRLTDSATFEKIKEELSNEYDWVTERLKAGLSDFDAGAYRYAEAIENGYFNANYIAKEYPDVELTENEIQRITEFTEALKEMPTEYFETKFNRPVYVEEFGTSFAAAVLPETTDPEVIKNLEDQGMMIFKYNNADDRANVMKAALTTVNMTRDVLFQTQAELYNDAMQFDNWKDFMESYTMDFNPEALEDPNYHNQVPADADAQWYQTTWELAHGITPEESTSKTEVAEKYEKEGPIPTVMDAMFDTDMATKDGMLENFLLKIYEIRNINFNAPDFMQPQDQEEEAYFNKLQQMQDFLNTRLSNVSFITQSTHYAKTGELSDPARKQLISLIEGNSREYRALYSEIMDDPNYAVEEEDLPRNYLAKKLRKYRLVSPNTDLERKSIDEINRLSKELSNREIAEKVARKTLRMDDELSNYVTSLNNQIKELQQQYDDLEKETTADYQRIADDEKRKLLRLHEQLLLARHNYNKKNDKVTRLIDKGIKISGKYKQNVQNYKADYDEIFRKYQDLYTTVDITKEVEAALKRQEDLVNIKEDLNAKTDEKNLAAEIKRLRVQLVKRTMRRVPFERIDYENARTLIAIQRMLEPNLFGGVNRWIGTEGPYLRGIISGILTDEEYKKEILRFLDKTAKASQAFVDFKTLLMETKTIADFDKWTNKQRKAAIRYLPKENWIRDLNLKELAKEREESIDLPINMVEVERPMKDNDGNVMTKKDGTPIMVTTFELKTTPEIERLVKDAVGTEMYNNIVSRPFAEWTTEEMEQLAIRVNQIYTEGRDILAAKKLAKIKEAEQIRQRIEQTVKNTGIVINDDDTPEEKAKKQTKINKILGLSDSLHGTQADVKKQSRINRLLHGYADANVLRVARILDNYSESTNVDELYRKENDCYNVKQRSINSRAAKIQQAMKENKIDEQLLNQKVTVHDAVYNQDFEFTIDELLYILAANEDYVDDEAMLNKGKKPGSLEANDDYAATSRNAVMFGNMFSSAKDLEEKERYAAMDKSQKELIESEDPELMQLKALNQLDATPGTTQYRTQCKNRFEAALLKAKEIEAQNPGLKVLRDIIAEDYAQQYERMNKVSIDVLNAPVHRVKCYVPLVRLESNGDTNENQVKEDLLGVAGVGKEWVNKGMTQRRVNTAPLNQKPVQMGLHKTWTNSVERTEHFIAYTDYVRELNRVYKSRDGQYTKNFIENRYGKGMVEYLNQYINEVANPNANKVRTAGDDFIRTFRGHTAPAYLAWKASAIIKQGATSPWPYMQFVNPAEYLAASWKCITSGGKLYETIREKSVFMNNRVMDPMNDLIKEMTENSKNKFTRTFNKINEKGMAGLEWIDWISVAPGWYACYLKKFEELNGKNTDVYEATKLRLEEENAYAEVGSSQWKSKDKIEALAMQAMKDDVEKRAVDYADDCTRQCQPSNRSVDLAPLFKDSSEAMKAYLQFQTSLNVIWQNIRYDIPYAVRNKQFTRIAGCVVGYVLAGVMMNAIMEGWPHGDDDEPDEVLKQFIWYSTTQFTDSVPMLGSALTTANQKLITGKSTYFGTSGTDMTPMVTKFINAATSTGTAIRNSDDEEKAKKAWMKAASNFVDGVNMSVGLPVSGLKEIGKLAGVGNKQPGLDLDLGSVYGIVDNITNKESE